MPSQKAQIRSSSLGSSSSGWLSPRALAAALLLVAVAAPASSEPLALGRQPAAARAIQTTEPARQPQSGVGSNPLDALLPWSKGEPAMPDFVRRTRPPEDALQYQPLVGERPTGPARKTPEQVTRTKAGLDSAAARNKARASRAFGASVARSPQKRGR